MTCAVPTSHGSRRSRDSLRSCLRSKTCTGHMLDARVGGGPSRAHRPAPLLLVATLRRDTGSEGWRFRTRVLTEFSHRATEIGLDSLPPAAAIEILATLLPGALDETTREGIVARADGNPLYLEELLRALLKQGAWSGSTGRGRPR